MIQLLNAAKSILPYWIAKFKQLKSNTSKFLIAAALLNLISFNSKSQTQYSFYDCIWKGVVIGGLYAGRTQSGSEVNLVVSTAVKTRFVFEVAVETYASTTFRNGILYAGSYAKNVNGSEKLRNSITSINNGYKLLSKSGERFFDKDSIINTSISMYFNEPLNIKFLFSEMFLTYVPVICMEPGKYKITMPDGSVNYYYYSKGSLVKIEIHSTFFSVSFVAKLIVTKSSLTYFK